MSFIQRATRAGKLGPAGSQLAVCSMNCASCQVLTQPLRPSMSSLTRDDPPLCPHLPEWPPIYHGSSAVSAPKSDLMSFSPRPILINCFFVENLWGFCRHRVSLLTPIILLCHRHIWPWIIYDWEASAISAPLNYRWIFLRPWGLKLRNKHGMGKFTPDGTAGP